MAELTVLQTARILRTAGFDREWIREWFKLRKKVRGLLK